MGSIYNRGTRGNPNWYVAYKDANGKRKAIPSKQPLRVRRPARGGQAYRPSLRGESHFANSLFTASLRRDEAKMTSTPPS